MRHYKFRWEELRGDQFDAWGFCWDYWEVDETDKFTRSVHVYDDGSVLRYDEEHAADGYGQLPEGPFDLDDEGVKKSRYRAMLKEIGQEEFEQAWALPRAVKRGT